MPPSPGTADRSLSDPDAMQVRLDDAATVIPFQRVEAERAADRHAMSDSGACLGPVGAERLLGGVPGAGALDQAGPVVVVAEYLPEREIVAPLFELADRRVASSEKRAETGVLCGRVFQSDQTESIVDDRGDVLVEQFRADRRADLAAGPVARVGHVAVRVDRSGENGPAFGASGDAGKQPVVVPPVVVARALHGIRGIPQLAGDDCGPRLRVAPATRTGEHPKGGAALNDSADRVVGPPVAAARGGMPVVGQHVGNLPPADAIRAHREDPLDDLARDRVRLDAALSGASVAVRGADHEPTGGVRFAHRGGEMLVGLVALPFGHDEQQPEHGATHRRCGVKALGDADNPRATLVEVVDRGQATDDRSSEPVKPGDDYSRAYSSLDPVERLGHAGSIHSAARPIEVFVDHADSYTVGLGPAGDRVPLGVGRLEALAGPSADLRHADVPVHDRPLGSHRPRIVAGVGSWGAPDRITHSLLGLAA